MSRGASTYQPASDADLARTISSKPAGDAGAEEAELYRRFAPRVRLYGLKHLRDAGAADDLAQEVLIVTIEQLRAQKVRDPDKVGSFILSTSRLMSGTLRRTDQRRRHLVEQSDATAMMQPIDVISLDIARLEPCLQSLDERDRTVIILTFYSEKSSGEIATELQTTAGAIRVCRHRAVQRLRDCIGLGGAS